MTREFNKPQAILYVRELKSIVLKENPGLKFSVELGLKILKLFKQGSLRSHHLIGNFIKRIYKITPDDLRLENNKRLKLYRKIYQRKYKVWNKTKLADYQYNYYLKNRVRIKEQRKKKNTPSEREKRNEKNKIMRKLYKEYLSDLSHRRMIIDEKEVNKLNEKLKEKS